ncbi:unnamed protein product, partial [marine sediment metagenome]
EEKKEQIHLIRELGLIEALAIGLGSMLSAGIFVLSANAAERVGPAHVLFCLVPAFFIAGALSGLIPKEIIVKYLGRRTNKIISYTVASISGLLIAVCSCTILPLFAGIRKRGAGLGPAITFLFVGPSINILAITLTGTMIGWESIQIFQIKHHQNLITNYFFQLSY